MEPDPRREQDDKAIARLLEVLGGVFLAVGGKDMLTSAMSTTPISTGSTVICCVGAGVLVCGLFWHRMRPRSETRFTRSLAVLASDARFWYVPLLAFGAYFGTATIISEVRQNNEIAALRNDLQSIARVLERGVLPRHLNKRQQSAISSFLLQFEPHEYAFRLSNRDEEAGSYRADIEQALIKGGWARSAKDPYEYVIGNDIQSGVSLNFIQTQEHSQKPEDPRNPKPDRLLMMALGLAGIRLDSSGGGSGPSITEDRLVITVGHRRMDSFELTSPDSPY